jgi:hypothetical protein
MTDEQVEAAATIQAIAEEMNSVEKRWAAGKLRRQGRRLLEALDKLTQDGATTISGIASDQGG